MSGNWSKSKTDVFGIQYFASNWYLSETRDLVFSFYLMSTISCAYHDTGPKRTVEHFKLFAGERSTAYLWHPAILHCKIIWICGVTAAAQCCCCV